MTTTERKPPRALGNGVKLYDERHRTGRWRVVWKDPATGKRRSLQRRDHDSAVQAGVELADLLGDRTVAALCRTYLSGPHTAGWSAGYRKRQTSLIRSHVIPVVGDLPAADIDARQLAAVPAAAAEAGVSDDTLLVLRSLLTSLVRHGYVSGALPVGRGLPGPRQWLP